MLVAEKPTPTKNADKHLAYIENELNSLGRPFIRQFWTDEFFLAENLQNYFAEIIAGYTLWELKTNENFDIITNNILIKRSQYYKFSKEEKQELLLFLIKEQLKLQQLTRK